MCGRAVRLWDGKMKQKREQRREVYKGQENLWIVNCVGR